MENARSQKYSLEELLAQMPADWKMDDEMRAWERLVPVGLEYAGEVTEEDGGFVARCLNPEVASDGAAPDEALANLREALELYFEEPTALLVDRISTSENEGIGHGYRVVGSGALVVNRKRYDSPSAAAVAITGSPANSWRFWEWRFPGKSSWQQIETLGR